MTDNREEYYESMLNSLAGIQDDLIANDAPKEAQDLIYRCLNLCKEDFSAKFGPRVYP